MVRAGGVATVHSCLSISVALSYLLGQPTAVVCRGARTGGGGGSGRLRCKAAVW